MENRQWCSGSLVRLVMVAWIALGMLGACGPAGTAPGGTAGGSAPASGPAGAGPAGGSGTGQGAQPSGGAPASERPEKDTFVIAGTLSTPSSLPLHVAMEAGYFQNHGLTVEATVASSTLGVQGAVSGSLDGYWGGTAGIGGRLGGADLIYVAVTVDRNTQLLVGQQGVTTVPQLRGKVVATTLPGAFGELVLMQTAKDFNLVPGQDFAIRHNAASDVVYLTFLQGQADAAVLTTPWAPKLAEQGFPVIVDYFQRGLRIPGPALILQRDFARKHPNLVKAFLRGYLDGVKRSFDDRDYALDVHMKVFRVDDRAEALKEYEDSARTWNKDLTVDRASIEWVLQFLPIPNAKDANPDEFYDNSVIQEINATYAPRLFPELAGRR